jgi:predicted esterase
MMSDQWFRAVFLATSGYAEWRMPIDPHASGRIVSAGPAPQNAAATLILLHGRGASAESILTVHEELGLPALAALAPQAGGNSWYPHSFLAPLESNQPWLDSSLAKIASIVADLVDRSIPIERVAIMGFSQGACLATEFVARNPRRYGAVIALTGGLIGPPGTPRKYPGSLAGTPIFLGTSDPDPHVPLERVQETKNVFTRMGASVELRCYPGMPHTINEDELLAARQLLQSLLGQTL